MVEGKGLKPPFRNSVNVAELKHVIKLWAINHESERTITDIILKDVNDLCEIIPWRLGIYNSVLSILREANPDICVDLIVEGDMDELNRLDAFAEDLTGELMRAWDWVIDKVNKKASFNTDPNVIPED